MSANNNVPNCDITINKDEYYAGDSAANVVGNIFGLGVNYFSSLISCCCCVLFLIIFLIVYFSIRKNCTEAEVAEGCKAIPGFNVGTITLLSIVGYCIIFAIYNMIRMYFRKRALEEPIKKGRPCFSKTQNKVIN
jgi:amino acid transporter